MAITDSFRDAVSSGNVKGIRIMMKDSLLVDPTFAEFNEMSRLAQSVNSLYDQHDGRELQKDKSAWNDYYMDKLMVQVVGNFSHERLNHLIEVVRYLRPINTSSQTSAFNLKSTPQHENYTNTQRPKQSNYQEQKRQDEKNDRVVSLRVTKIAVGAVVGGTVGGTIAGVAGGTVVVGVAVGAVIAGAVVAIATNGEQ